MYDHKAFQYAGFDDLLSQLGAFLSSYGFTVDVSDATQLHFHDAATEHYHIEISTSSYRDQRGLYFGLCTGWKSGDKNYSDQPGALGHHPRTGSLETNGSSNDWTIQGNAHLFIANGIFYLTYSVTRANDTAPIWGWVSMGKIPTTQGTYTDNPRFAAGPPLTSLWSDGRLSWSYSGMFGSDSSNSSHVMANYPGGPEDGGHSQYYGESSGKKFFQPEQIAAGAAFTAGTQGGYRILLPLEFWVNNSNAECFFVGVETNVHLMSGEGRIPFEEFTVNSKKYVFCPASFRAGKYHYGYAIHINQE